MDRDRWERLEELFGRALAVSDDERGRAVRELTHSDPEMAAELSTLLDAVAADDSIDALRRRIVGAPGEASAPATGASLVDATSDPWVGRRVGHYRVLELLGSGGMGLVYRAHDEILDRAVALKIIAPEISRVSEARERFLVEARAASALDHPNVCTIHEIGEEPSGYLYLVMPAYEGETLAERLERGSLETPQALEVAFGIASALEAAHAKGIVHGDVKPSNVMLTNDGRVLLLDFGLARSRAGDDGLAAGAGTARYRSPEQERGVRPDARSDVWMAGVTFLEMLPVDDPRPEELAYSLRALARRAASHDPDQRPPDGAALASALLAMPAVARSRAMASPRDVAKRGGIRFRTRKIAGFVTLASAIAVTLVVVRLLWASPLPSTVPAERHVLWVDDNPENNTDWVQELRRRGVQVTIALSTAEGIALFDPERIGWVVSDMARYEGTDDEYAARAGFDLLDALAARYPSVRMAFCTSYRAAEANRAEARAKGAEMFSECDGVVELVSGGAPS